MHRPDDVQRARGHLAARRAGPEGRFAVGDVAARSASSSRSVMPLAVADHGNRAWARVGLAGFGVGGAVHPVGDGRPVLLGYGLGDRAMAGQRHDGAAGPHRQPLEERCWPIRPSRNSLRGQTAGDSPSCAVVARGQTVNSGEFAGSGPRSRPVPAAPRLTRSNWRTWPRPLEAAQERAQGGRRLDYAAQGLGGSPRCATRRRRQCSRRPPAPTPPGSSNLGPS